MARIISVCNQKGGVGKTTSIINIGSYLAALGKRVLIIDFDPQGNTTSGLGINPKEVVDSIYHGILGYAEAANLIKNVHFPYLHLIPANQHLAGSLVELVNLPEREFYLRKFVNRVRHYYDYILIDLPPSLSLLTINGMVASDEVIIPIQCEYYSLEGLSQLLETVDMINANLNRQIKVAGAVLTMYDKREKLSREISREVRKHFPHFVYETEIPRSVALAEAPSFSQPIIIYRPSSPGAKAYEKLTREIINQEPNNENIFIAGQFTNLNP
jgi:chromosome partitioning protein